MMCASGQLPPRSHLLVHRYWMQMRPPGSRLAPYGTGAAELIVGLRPSAGAAGLLAGAFGSTSKPSAAAAAMPLCAMVGWSPGLPGLPDAAGGAGPERSMVTSGPEPAPGAGRARRSLAGAGACGGTMMVRLGLLERLLLFWVLTRFFRTGLLFLLGLFLARRPGPRPWELRLLPLEELDLRFLFLAFGFFFFSTLVVARSAIVVALCTLDPRWRS
mmetsp:Transcript_72178/g.222994  ORF Transcript_72178/g.222994 Transcript_72178/m.222994 type:complete len:216 (-) Transcript_72178:252-899(-)